MKSTEQWLSEYQVSHRNKTNKLIHYFCVPLIMYSLLGLIDSARDFTNIPFPISPAYFFIFFCSLFYFLLNKELAIIILTLSGLMVFSFEFFPSPSIQVYSCLIIFIVSWVFQFIGHKIEGKKPSFLQDIAFLLVGPLWVINDLTDKRFIDSKKMIL